MSPNERLKIESGGNVLLSVWFDPTTMLPARPASASDGELLDPPVCELARITIRREHDGKMKTDVRLPRAYPGVAVAAVNDPMASLE